jgi:hypothetical protein
MKAAGMKVAATSAETKAAGMKVAATSAEMKVTEARERLGFGINATGWGELVNSGISRKLKEIAGVRTSPRTTPGGLKTCLPLSKH